MLSHLKYIFFAIIFAVLFTAGFTKAAWRDAPAGPPNYGLVSPDTQADYKPVNLGSSPQAKLGGFTIGTSTPLSTDILQIESSTANAGVVFSRGGTVVGKIIANTANQLNIQGNNQPIRFSTNGFTNEHMRVATNGSVGIGTEAPSARLAIGDTGSPGDTIAAYANSSQSTLYAEQLGSGYAIYASGGLNYFSGNVGIGTTVPRATFHVDGSTILGGNGVNVILGASQAFPKGSVAYEGNGDWSSGGAFWAGPMIYRSKRWPDAGGGAFPDNNFGELMLQGTSYGSSYNKGISFVTWDGTVADPAIRMRIKEDGNVGIGTATPIEKLEVIGTIRQAGNSADGLTGIHIGDSAVRLFQTNDGNKSFGIYTNSTEKMRILGNGNVGIGTTDPGSYKLNVAGSLNATTITQGGTDVCLSTGTNCPSAGVPAWTSITGKPTTVTGYGITDMGSQSVSYANSAGSANGVAWLNITGRPSGLDDGDDVGTNYVSGLIAGTGVTISGTVSNGWTPRIDVAEADTLQTVTSRGKITDKDITAVAFYVSSDARLKKNVETISSALEKLGRARGVSYDLASGQGARQIGVIAQELEQEFPELVKTDDNGYKAVAYDRLSAVLIEAVKELKAQNQILQQRLDHLEKKW